MTENENENENNENTVTPAEKLEQVCDMPNPDPEDPGNIHVDAKKNGKSARIFYNFGTDLASMIERFGEGVVFNQARAQMKIKLQSAMRSYLETSRDVLDLAAKYRPGVALERPPADMGKATENYFKELTEEEQDIMIAKLMEAKGS